MISRSISAAATAAFLFLVGASTALAQQGSDPKSVGKNLEDIVSPNAKSFWWVVLVVGVLIMAASRKASRMAAFLGFMALAGIVLYNPAGVTSFVRGLANAIV